MREIDGDRIVSGRVSLDPLAVDDAGEMVGVLSGAALYRFIGGRSPSLAELRGRYARLVAGRSPDGAQEWRNWIIRVDGRAVGTVQATITDQGARAEIAWVVGVPWQGRGYASEAARALVEWLRARGVASIQAHIHPDHQASSAVARHVGLEPTETFEDGERLWITS